jgi:hypothetical protein
MSENQIVSEITEIGVSKMAKYIAYSILANRPANFWSQPGVGKSAIIKEVAMRFGYHVEDIRLSQIESIDLRGVPSKSYMEVEVNEDGQVTDEEMLSAVTKASQNAGAPVVEWAMPDFLVRAKQHAEKGTPTIFFFDELNHADDSTQAAAYQFILEKRIGCFTLNEDDRVFGACNYENEGSIANPMSVALANRMAHYYVKHDVKSWLQWGRVNNVHPYILAAVERNPDLLYSFPDDDGMSKNKGFNTPRTLEYASDYLYVITERQAEVAEMFMNSSQIQDDSKEGKEFNDAIFDSFKVSEAEIDDDVMITLSACLGSVAARAINTFIKIGKDLPSSDDILSGKYKDIKDFKVEKNRPDVQAVLSNQCLSTLYTEYRDLIAVAEKHGQSMITSIDSKNEEIEKAKHTFFQRYEEFILFANEYFKENLFMMSIIVRLIREMRIQPLKQYMKSADTVQLVLAALRKNSQDSFNTAS